MSISPNYLLHLQNNRKKWRGAHLGSSTKQLLKVSINYRSTSKLIIFVSMSHSLRIFIIMLLSCNTLSAQAPSDFNLRVENSFLKLYENPDTAIYAAKEIRTEDDPLVIKDIIAQAFLLKGNYLESVRTAFEKSSIQKTDNKTLVALVLAREFYHLNLYEQTSKILDPLILLKTEDSKSAQENLWMAQIYQLQAKNFIALKNTKAAERSLLKSTELVGNNSNFLIILKQNNLLKAEIDLQNGDLEGAERKCDELLRDLNEMPRAIYLRALTQQLRANLFFENQQHSEAIESLESALKSIEEVGYETLKNSLYFDLSKNYLGIKDNIKFEFYKNKYIESSNFLENQKKEARREIVQLNTEIETEKNTNLLNQKKTNFYYLISISSVLLAFLLYLLVREVQKSKTLFKQIRFFRYLHHKQPLVEEVKPKETSKKQLIIPKEKEQEILEKLERFEESKKYLDNNMSLATLAVKLDTNTKYLSEIINNYKGKNFNTYINELRIKHVIHLLSTDSSYLQYKISYIAEVGGFTSHSAFTNVFKSITGMSPNEYMQTLRTQRP